MPEIVEELSIGFGGAAVYDMAGGTGCLNPIFVSCKAHDGMHFIAPDYAYIELYDPRNRERAPMVDGAEGEVCLHRTRSVWTASALHGWRFDPCEPQTLAAVCPVCKSLFSAVSTTCC